jgi:hypothetical protein
MKRLMLALMMLSGAAWGATSVTMDGPMTDANAAVGQAYDRNFDLNMDDHNIDVAAVQVIIASATISTQTFTSGTASSTTIKVVTPTALSSAAATGQLTAVSVSVAAGVAGTGVVGFGTNNGSAEVIFVGTPARLDLTIGGNVTLGAVSSATAANFVTAVNLSSNSVGVVASQSGTESRVTLTCIAAGTACNSYTISSSSSAQVSTAAFSGGINPVAVTVGGYVYRAGSEFAIGATTATMAANLAAAITATEPDVVLATANVTCPGCGIVYATATVAGSAGNLSLKSSLQTAISTSASTMTGGQDNAYICINGQCLYANKHWKTSASVFATAENIATAINSSFTIVVATDTGANGVVLATSTSVGLGAAYAVYSSTQSALLVAPFTSSSPTAGWGSGAMIGGTTASYSLNGQIITLSTASAGMPLALGVWLSTSAVIQNVYWSTATVGGTATKLQISTTYYVIPVTANSIELSWTSTGAVAGLPMTFVSSTTKTTADVVTLNPTAIAGTPQYGFWTGNDGVTFSTVTAASVTQNVNSYVATSSSTFFDLGTIDYKWLRLNVKAPTGGAMSIQAIMHGEKR